MARKYVKRETLHQEKIRILESENFIATNPNSYVITLLKKPFFQRGEEIEIETGKLEHFEQRRIKDVDYKYNAIVLNAPLNLQPLLGGKVWKIVGKEKIEGFTHE